MSGNAGLADCTWHEPGGRDAALAIGAFLSKVGIEVRVKPIDSGAFLPGLALEQGAIVIDPAVAVYPGDVLHEAGHLAVLPAERRAELGTVEADGGDEMAAIAWSVAAAHACGMPLEVIFHAAGYRGGSEGLIEAWSGDRHPFGVPLLVWYGMTSAETFPAMTRWLR